MWLPDFKAPAPYEYAALTHRAPLARSSYPRLLCVVEVDQQDGPLPFSSSSGKYGRLVLIFRNACLKLDTPVLRSQWVCILEISRALRLFHPR